MMLGLRGMTRELLGMVGVLGKIGMVMQGLMLRMLNIDLELMSIKQGMTSIPPFLPAQLVNMKLAFLPAHLVNLRLEFLPALLVNLRL